MRILEKIDKYWLVLLLVLVFPTLGALLVPGFYGASDDIHIAWLFEMDKILKEGQIPPRFVPDLSFGFGYPLFNFVFPLPFYLGEIFHLAAFSFVDSVKLVFGVSVVMSAIFMYLFLREIAKPSLALLGVVMYSFAPYRATDLYVRGAIGENVAFVFLPLLALTTLKLTNPNPRRGFKWLGIGGLSLAGLILSHNITTYMFFPFILLLGILRIVFVRRERVKKLINFGIFILLGFLVSAYFWLPAILESSLMKYDTVFNFRDHFPTLRQLLTPYFGYGSSVPGPFDGMSFFLGISSTIVIIFSLVFTYVYWKRLSGNQKIILVWAIISLLIAIFMMNYRSAFIWQNVPYLAYFQFPWRFLIMTTFLIPILLISFERIKYLHWLVLGLLLLTVLINSSYFRPQDFLGRTDNYYLDRYIPDQESSVAYLQTSEEYLRLPKRTQFRPNKKYPLVYSESLGSGQDGIVAFKTKNSLDIDISTNSEKDLLIGYNKYDFPGWSAKIDGQETKIVSGEPFGQITIKVPKGRHNLSISFGETGFKKLLDFVSFLALCVFLVFIFRIRK